ncbi:MAG TPA: hypothetical protein VF519_15650 [Mycobacteriales bacterium]|jgi:hypothetical protein
MSYITDLADKIRSQVPEALIPAESTSLFLMYAVLARAKGAAVTAADVHDAWAAWMESSGREHDAIRPFESLSDDTKDEDLPFVDAIRKACDD